MSAEIITVATINHMNRGEESETAASAVTGAGAAAGGGGGGGSIRAIGREHVHRICCGQVVVDLATAVKELVENALDAGATVVEVKLKEMGAEAFEVTDNGCGISKGDYEGVARKHYTSKIEEFADLDSIKSFGFRGEALNALNELSKSMVIMTRREDEDVGTQLMFERDGSLKSTKPVARGSKGTTVIIEKLFDSLPVRRNEFVRNIKKQYQKLLRILQSYAVVSVGVKISVVNVTKDSKQVVLATQSGASMVDNISSVFGSKFLSTLVKVDIDCGDQYRQIQAALAAGQDAPDFESDDEDIGLLGQKSKSNKREDEGSLESEMEVGATGDIDDYGAGDEVEKENQPNRSKSSTPSKLNSASSTASRAATFINSSRVVGYVSKAGAGVGRSDNDRQFLFCNGRPVDLPRVTKILNEVWRRYEMKHKPAFIIDVKVPAGSFDVNLTPDKREIVLVHEKQIIECIREVVDGLYLPSRNTFPVSQQQRSLLDRMSQPTLGFQKLNESSNQNSVESQDVDLNSEENSTVEIINRQSDSSQSNYGSQNLSQTQSQSQSQSYSSYDAETFDSSNVGSSFLESKDDVSEDVVWATDNQVKTFGLNELRRSSRASSTITNTKSEQASISSYISSSSSSSRTAKSIIGSKRKPSTSGNYIEVVDDEDTDDADAVEEMDEDEDENEDENEIVNSQKSRSTPRKSSSRSSKLSNSNPRRNSRESQDQSNSDSDVEEVADDGEEDDAKESYVDADQDDQIEFVGRTRSGRVASIQNYYNERSVTRSSSVRSSSSERPKAVFTGVDGSIRSKIVTKPTSRVTTFATPTAHSWSFDPEAVLSSYKADVESRRCKARIHEPTRDHSIDINVSSTEDVLSRVIQKQDFPKMKIYGQFNLGFMICELNGDIYILDQHACDEKYRFETLQQTTTIHQQPLISPLDVETNAAEEISIISNLHVFEANGFKLRVDEDAPPGHRVKLLAVPLSKSVQFDVEDVHELASLLSDEASNYVTKLILKNDINANITNHNSKPMDKHMIRLPKLASMFASRACRSAVMIGMALSAPEMRGIVDRLATIEQPWNCPHGRPTMRHLFDFDKYQTMQMKARSQFLAGNSKLY